MLNARFNVSVKHYRGGLRWFYCLLQIPDAGSLGHSSKQAPQHRNSNSKAKPASPRSVWSRFSVFRKHQVGSHWLASGDWDQMKRVVKENSCFQRKFKCCLPIHHSLWGVKCLPEEVEIIGGRVTGALSHQRWPMRHYGLRMDSLHSSLWFFHK